MTAYKDQYSDSDNPSSTIPPLSIRTLSRSSRHAFHVAATKEKVSDPISEFIRELIARWEADGKKLYVLAAEAELAKSMPSQIKARTSDATFYSASKLAKPLGFRDLPDLVNAAWTWWHSSDRSQIPASSSEAARAEGMRLAHSYAVSKAQIERVLERFPLPDYEHQDVLWWLARFHEERSRDAERAGARRAAKHVEAHAKRGQKQVREQKERLAAARTSATRRPRKAS